MEQTKIMEHDYDSDIIICDDPPETIIIQSSPEKKKKSKKKKCKRKVKRGINYNNNMESLVITQKVKMKKTKFKCIVNINTINTVWKDRKSDSIIRFDRIVCKKEAYYDRILPTCMRKMCKHKTDSSTNCCRSTVCRGYKKEKAEAGSLSSVSSIALTEILEFNNMSYENISNGNFSSGSDEELDTLIKRTKLREQEIDDFHSNRSFIATSTPIATEDAISPYSIDTDKTIHSDTTMILKPLSNEAYSPTASLEYMNVDNLEIFTTSGDDVINNVIDLYSPTITSDIITLKNLDYSIQNVNKIRDGDKPYSPMYTP